MIAAWRNYYVEPEAPERPPWGGYVFDHEPRARLNAEKVGRGSSRAAYRVRIVFKPGADPKAILGGLLVEGPADVKSLADLLD